MRTLGKVWQFCRLRQLSHWTRIPTI